MPPGIIRTDRQRRESRAMNTEQICKHCRHWDASSKTETYGDCTKITLKNKNETTRLMPTPGMKAYAQDASDYMAKVCCEEDFGCLLWEPKQ